MATSKQLIDRLRSAQTATLRNRGDESGDKYVQIQATAGRNLQSISLTDAQYDCLVKLGINADSPREPNLMIQKLIECGVIDSDALS